MFSKVKMSNAIPNFKSPSQPYIFCINLVFIFNRFKIVATNVKVFNLFERKIFFPSS